MKIAAPTQDNSVPLTETERAMHVLSRLAFGPRPGQLEEVIDMGVDTWVDEQFESKPAQSGPLANHLSDFITLEMTPAECRNFTDVPLPPNAGREERRKRNQARRKPIDELTQAVALRAILSDRQVEEVLCEFWRNHFNVSFTKGYPSQAYIPNYEARVVRANVLGNFQDMLTASAKHPAMLHYLDNHLSRKPPSKAELNDIEIKARNASGSRDRGTEAAAIAAQRGLNENYARELLELHTLGVDREYRQKDVIAVAESLTGWTIHDGRKATYDFVFKPDMHVQEDRHFLGFSLRKDKEKGPGQGERILEILANHKGTAEFVSMKLVRYLTSDQPPSSLVKKVAKSYSKSDGDIPSMVRTVLKSKEFWSREHYRSKFKTPFEFLVSAIRVTGAVVTKPEVLGDALGGMGQPIYSCDDPTGYYDTAEAWLDPGVLAPRWELALKLARGDFKGIEMPDSFFYELPTEKGALRWMQAMIAKVLPAGASSRTLAMLFQVIQGETNPDYDELGPVVLGLLLGSPDFQQQ
ncbi:MAG: DUF1800 domain-containing protein [Planctomycetota bacterium]|nr:DUF1800 domain-containing protein [Planctomycetota bacterium]